MSAVAVDWRPTASLETLRLRARLLRGVRDHFASTGALEVETPVLVGSAVTDVQLESLEVRRSNGGPAGFLHTSPEYAMKRLLCAGVPDIYQISHVFRDGERGRFHNPEFTMVEWYRTGIDHWSLMNEVEHLLRELLEPLLPVGTTHRLTYADAVRSVLGVDALDDTSEAIHSALRRRDIDVPAALRDDRDGLLDLAMAALVAPSFPADRLTFVHDFPASQAALARLRGPVASRFEAFWGNLELANGFHELGDADEQAKRFEHDRSERARRGQPVHRPDALFLEALRSGLPSCSGVALGFDRVVMVASGARHIDEVLAFPAERA